MSRAHSIGYSKYRLRLKISNNFAIGQAVLITPNNVEMTRHPVITENIPLDKDEPAPAKGLVRKWGHGGQQSTRRVGFKTEPTKSEINLVFVSEKIIIDL